MKTSQKGFISPLLLALVALLLAGGGAYVYVQNKQVKQSETVNSTTATSTAQTSDVQTADWKTYTNTRFGFEVKYPSDWSGNQLGNKDAYYGGDQYQLNNNKGDEENVHYSFYISSEMEVDLSCSGKIKSITFNDIAWSIYTDTCPESPGTHIYANTNRPKFGLNIVVVSGKNLEETLKELNIILSNFKFIP